MTKGTPGFNGERLQEAREGRGLSQADLARLLEVSRQAVSSYEAGTISPAPNVTRAIAEILGVSPAFFRREQALGATMPQTSPAYFRSNAKALAGDRSQGLFRLDLAVELIAMSMEFIEYPSVNIPDIKVAANPELLDDHFIGHVADRVRSHWSLGAGPIQNVVWALENSGIVVIRDEVATNDIDAFSAWRTDVPIVVLSSNKQSAVRSRWDAAHELGHLILHKDIDRLRLENSASLKLLEHQANRFAGAFLLPQPGYERSIVVPSLDEFREVKSRWLVSIQAQIERCFALGLISQSTRSRLWRQLKAKGWASREPLDDELPVEQPVLLKKAFEIAVEDREIDFEQFEIELGILPETAFRLMNLTIPSSNQLQSTNNVLAFPGVRIRDER